MKEVLKDEKGRTLKEWFYEEFWEKRPRVSEISGLFIGNHFSTIYYHHILPKNKWKHLTFAKDNIIILTNEEHMKVEKNMYFCEEINQRRIKLLEKYDDN